MPSYRGVDQADLIRSINDALELFETYSSGPVMQGYVDKLREGTPSPLAAIAQAQDDKSLVAALRGSSVHWLFARAGEVLHFHATNDTDGKGRDVLERLVAWNATGGAMTMEYNKFDEETDVWLAINYARKASMTEETLEKLAMVTDALSQDKVAIGNAFLGATSLIEMAHENAPEADMAKVYLELSLHERHVLKGSLMALNTLDGAQGDLTFQPAISRYGLLIEELTEGKINWTDPSIDAIRMKVEKALEPFYELDEVEMTGIGLIGDHNVPRDQMKQGIMFQSSARAAQAVANALPEMKVMDYDGNPIPPKKQKPPKPGFTL